MNQVMDWLRQVEAKLDEWGRPAWIVAMVVGFFIAWPIGLALLVYTVWSGRMKNFGKRWRGCGKSSSRQDRHSSGNVAFDEYRHETMKRLEDEQEAFVSFLDKLRKAKDQAEFEQFMADRGNGRGMEANPQPAT